MNIRSTKVQRPGNIIESRHQHAVSVLFTQSLTDADNLFVATLASIFQRMYLHRIIRNSRTILPNKSKGVKIGAKRDTTLLAKVGNQCLHLVR